MSKEKRRSRLVLRALLLVLTLVPMAGAGAVGFSLARRLPDISRLESYRPPLPTVVVDREGRPIGEFSEQRRRVVTLESLPAHLVKAFLASEDSAFFEHSGIHLGALIRAGVVNMRDGRIVQGGSTITQQLTKTVLLTPEKTVWRKLQDMALALQVERRLSKERILEIYLNEIYFGAGAYGVAEAALTYFSKEVSSLTLSESALLAGLPKAPSALCPMVNPAGAEQRRRRVLERMIELDYVGAAEGRAALDERPAILPRQTPESFSAAAYFVEEVRQALFEQLGADTVLRGGLRVETTLDLDLQREAIEAVRAGVESVVDRSGEPAEDGPVVEGALVSLDIASGEVLAMVGGYDFERSRFNRAVQAQRQPGSAFKVFAYGAMLERGYPAYGTVYDYQVEYDNPATGTQWRPRNDGAGLRGPVPLSEAFARSLNNATVRMVDEVGMRRVVDFARRAGIRSPLAPELGVALGTAEVTLLEITSAYGTFPNGGRPVEPRFIRRVLDRDGRELGRPVHVAELAPRETEEVISQVDAYLVTNLLRETVRRWYGTAHRAASLGPAIGGKTGSTNDNRDAWFVGFSPRIATGVWVGTDDNRPLGARESGARTALPIWSRFMKAALAEHPATTFEVPSGISFTTVDPHSGELRSTRREIAGWVPVAEGRDTRYAEFVPPPELEVVIEADSRGVLLPAPGGEPTAWPPPGPRPHLDAVR